MMKIGIVGSGGVAKALGSGYLSKGHTVMLGSRDTAKLDEWLSTAGGGATTGSFSDPAAFGEVVFLSVSGEGLLSAIELAGIDNFSGKTVIDVCNPMDFSSGVPPRFTATVGQSLGEQVQATLPDAKVVKAFNTMSAAVMTDPIFDGEPATHFIAGNDDGAKAEATKLIKEFGWQVEDLGGIDQAFFLEALASLYVNFAFKNNQWNQAFKLMKR